MLGRTRGVMSMSLLVASLAALLAPAHVLAAPAITAVAPASGGVAGGTFINPTSITATPNTLGPQGQSMWW
jgi:hypothetical protein